MQWVRRCVNLQWWCDCTMARRPTNRSPDQARNVSMDFDGLVPMPDWNSRADTLRDPETSDAVKAAMMHFWLTEDRLARPLTKDEIMAKFDQLVAGLKD